MTNSELAVAAQITMSHSFAEIGVTWVRNDTPCDPIRDRSSYAIGVVVRF